MPFLKPPAPSGQGLRAVNEDDKKDKKKDEVWTIVIKKGEALNIEYEK